MQNIVVKMKDVLVNTTTGNKWYSLDDVRKSFMLTEGKRKKLIANFLKKEGVAEFEDFKEEKVTENKKTQEEIDNNNALYLSMIQTPALKDGYKKMKEDELDAFFANIVNQDVDSAIRRHGQVVEFYELRYKFFMKTWNFRIKVSKFLKIFRNISILKKK